MPLKLRPPRPGRTVNYEIRGTYLGIRVERTTGTPDKATAQRALQALKRDIERGVFAGRRGPTFASAAIAYLDGGGDDRFIGRLNDHFGDTLLSAIGQAEIDEAAVKLYPSAAPATRNRQVYTPMSAIMKAAGVEKAVRRPKGAAGGQRLRWLWPEEAEKLFAKAAKVDLELAAMLVLLVYTGLRLGEALALDTRDLRIGEAFVYLPDSKTDTPRAIFLPPIVIQALQRHPRGLARRGRIFRFSKGQRLYELLAKAADPAGVPWFRFHHACHTYGTWMRRFGGLDTRGLVGTGRWADEKSAARYAHVVSSEEARRASLLPVPKDVFGENPGSGDDDSGQVIGKISSAS